MVRHTEEVSSGGEKQWAATNAGSLHCPQTLVTAFLCNYTPKKFHILSFSWIIPGR